MLTVTLVGFEALAVSTALPKIKDELHGLALYGWVFSAYMLGTLLGSVLAGSSADRHGPSRPFAIGMVVFSLGLVAAGTAPAMWLLVVARFVQGLGGGAIPAIAYVVVGRGYPPELRPRVFAIMSSAWVIPGIVGPVLSAFITNTLGWRWVFLLLVPLAVPAGLATLIALRSLERHTPTPATTQPESAAGDRRRAAIAVVFGVGIVFVGTGGVALPLAIAFVAVGAVIAARAYARLVPAGTLTLRRGLPVTIAVRAFQMFALFGLDAFLPHLVSDVRGKSLNITALALATGVVAWTAGSWAQERLYRRATPRSIVSSGLVMIGLGGTGLIVGTSPSVPIAFAIVAFGLASFGMGLGFSAVSVAMLALADPARQGDASGALAVTENLFVAITTGIGGACIRLADIRGWTPRTGIVLAYPVPVLIAFAGAIVAWRIPTYVQREASPISR